VLSGWELEEPLLGWEPFRWIGAALVFFGALPLADAIVRFAREGRRSPALWTRSRHLVVTGPYRCVRNPMYVGVLLMTVGQGLFFGSVAILAYAACAALFFHLTVILLEEPVLRSRFGAEYAAYCREVLGGCRASPRGSTANLDRRTRRGVAARCVPLGDRDGVEPAASVDVGHAAAPSRLVVAEAPDGWARERRRPRSRAPEAAARLAV
jgi:hypothetical protein